jgi:hypothetical protein
MLKHIAPSLVLRQNQKDQGSGFRVQVPEGLCGAVGRPRQHPNRSISRHQRRGGPRGCGQPRRRAFRLDAALRLARAVQCSDRGIMTHQRVEARRAQGAATTRSWADREEPQRSDRRCIRSLVWSGSLGQSSVHSPAASTARQRAIFPYSFRPNIGQHDSEPNLLSSQVLRQKQKRSGFRDPEPEGSGSPASRLAGPPQIRTCRFPASGSSRNRFARRTIDEQCAGAEAGTSSRSVALPATRGVVGSGVVAHATTT